MMVGLWPSMDLHSAGEGLVDETRMAVKSQGAWLAVRRVFAFIYQPVGVEIVPSLVVCHLKGHSLEERE